MARLFIFLIFCVDLRLGNEIDISLNSVAKLEVAAPDGNDRAVLRHLLHPARRHAEDCGSST